MKRAQIDLEWYDSLVEHEGDLFFFDENGNKQFIFFNSERQRLASERFFSKRYNKFMDLTPGGKYCPPNRKQNKWKGGKDASVN